MTGGTVIGRDGRRLALAGAVALLALACVLAQGGPGADARGPVSFKLKPVISGDFHDPVYATEAPGGNGLLFVVSRSGKIRPVEDGKKTKKPFLDIRDRVQAGGEEGLLSMAFDEDYETNRLFYVYYTNEDGDIQIDAYERQENNPLRASKNSGVEIITITHDQASNHNGGQLQTGPDGSLYAATGDGGPQEDPENDAQDIDSLLGKLIRIDPTPGGGYTVPPDNPYVGVAGADEIYAIGLRNPWRFSFDSEDGGALTIGDVGGADREEIDYVPGPDPGLGANFGWNDYEGFLETDFGTGANASPHTEPIADFDHGDNFCAIAGGYVVRDPGLPAIEGEYVFADLCDNKIRTLEIPSGDPGTKLKVKTGSPVAFGEGENGQIYVVDLGGKVYRLEQIP